MMFPKKGNTKKKPGVLRSLLRKDHNHPDIKLPDGTIIKWGVESDEYEYGLSKDGYLTIKYGPKKEMSCLVHRLVAEQYLPNKKCKPIVHHIDCNKRNNLVENLMWVTEYEHAQFHEHLRVGSSK